LDRGKEKEGRREKERGGDGWGAVGAKGGWRCI
jgi:hypothetical protein